QNTPNTFTGEVVVNDGTLELYGHTEVVAIQGDVTVNNGASLLQYSSGKLTDNATVTLNDGATYDTGGYRQDIGTLNLNDSSVIGDFALDRLDIRTAINSTGTSSISDRLGLANNNLSIDVDSGTLTIDALISYDDTVAVGGGGFTKSGAGTLVLDTASGSNNFQGDVVVSEGVVNIRHDDALGTYNTGGETIVASGAQLQVQGGLTVLEELTLSGTGIGGTGALRNVADTNAWDGNIGLAANAEIQADTGTTF